jgi:chemotaxis protein methyltransferase CheR
MDDALLQSFKQIISERTGLYIREQDNKKLIDTISSRIKSLGLSSENEYYRLLNSDNSKPEYEEFIVSLTTGETYFFRDKGQFSLLKNHLLPQLLEKQMKDKTLKIWSAGCSTGEEPYSIAILINELISDKTKWNISIFGTDINGDLIKKAKKGSYHEWSFRGIDPDLFKRYFYKSKDEWRIDERIKGLVTFKTGNLITDIYPDHDIYDIDLIVCRNVFIYFNEDIVFSIIKKFEDTLKNNGYLLTGHAELPHKEISALKPKIFPESVVYRKSSEFGVGSEESKLTLPAPSTGWMPRPSHQRRGDTYAPSLHEEPKFTPSPLAGEGRGEGDMSEAKELFKKGEYLLTIKRLEYILSANPEFFDAHCLIGQTYANLGEYDKAESHLKKAIEIDKFNLEPYYLLAQISREKGKFEEEEEFLKKVIYLNPSHIPAYLEMGIIYEGKGDRERAFKMRNTALNLLKALPSDSHIEPYTELAAEELISHIQEMIR